MRKEINDCNERVSKAELHISSMEDDVTCLHAKLQTLESKCKNLEDSVLGLESHSRRNNLRLVRLPVEGRDPCFFLEKWLLGPLRNDKSHPRTLIMKFLKYRDKLPVTNAAQARREIKFLDQQVRFYPYLVTGIQQWRKLFDPICKELRNLGIRHGIWQSWCLHIEGKPTLSRPWRGAGIY